MRYLAIHDSYGYMGRYWTQGDTVEPSDGSKPPKEHFRVLEPGEEVPKEESNELVPMSMSEASALGAPAATPEEVGLSQKSAGHQPKKGSKAKA